MIRLVEELRGLYAANGRGQIRLAPAVRETAIRQMHELSDAVRQFGRGPDIARNYTAFGLDFFDRGRSDCEDYREYRLYCTLFIDSRTRLSRLLQLAAVILLAGPKDPPEGDPHQHLAACTTRFIQTLRVGHLGASLKLPPRPRPGDKRKGPGLNRHGALDTEWG